MNFNELLQDVVQKDTLASLRAVQPELTLCATIIAILLAKILIPAWKQSPFHLTVIGLATAMFVGFPWHGSAAAAVSTLAQPIFTASLVSDSFTTVVRFFLLTFAMLFAAFAEISTDGEDDRTEFYVLILGALVGMCLMISANHVLIVLLGVEMASVPCYVLAGLKRRQSKSSEAALKYAVFGAGAAGVMMFGLSLLAGGLGTAHLPAMAANLAKMIQGGISPQQITILSLGGLMVMVGVGFKLSAVPFHFWAPDVFEGATAEVAAFLSVASKAAALGLLMRLCSAFAFPADMYFHSPIGELLPQASLIAALAPVRQYIVAIVAVLAAVTCTFGNLAAYGQTNMKRLLAYSTIAHAGYMMMPVAAAVALIRVGSDGVSVDGARDAVASLVTYISIYLFMNLAAFAIVAFLRNATGSEEIADYAGLVRRSPGLTVCMAIVMFSLVGLPPLAGFQAKWVMFYSLIEAAHVCPALWALLSVGLLNTILSLFYYLRVVRVMALSPEPLYREAPTIPLTSMVGMYCGLLTAPMLLLFFALDRVLPWAHAAASTLF
ncbi:MAG: NADH-quinone oxidoreductase subunit N [Planctomycetaceae bacterium]|nr:NADH-quinone oxidoreductase subunit N [Planctomycetaceae bacterium]